MLAQHPLMRHNTIFKRFLTCENSDEFEDFKNNSSYAYGDSSIVVNSLKKFNIQDSFSYLYSAFKTKYFDSAEPEEMQTSLELDDISARISKYLPIIEKYIGLLNCEIKFYKEHIARQDELSSALEDLVEKDADFDKCLNDGAEYYMKYSLLNRKCLNFTEQVLAEAKRERLSLEGIKSAIASRKDSIEQYNTILKYAKGKIESENKSAIDEVTKLREDIEKVKDRILKINTNLDMELKNYSKNRTEGLKRILRSDCSANYEIGSRIMEFAEGKQKNFPFIKLTVNESDYTKDGVRNIKTEEDVIDYID